MLSIYRIANIIKAFIAPSRCLEDLRNTVNDCFEEIFNAVYPNNIIYIQLSLKLLFSVGGGRVVRRCCVSYIIGASN